MAQYRIVCTTQEPVSQPTTHAHIVTVGTGNNPDQYSKYWMLADVLRAMDSGDIFYTKGETSGKTAYVEKVVCPSCRDTYIIRSAPDAITDNNLDNLRRCQRLEAFAV